MKPRRPYPGIGHAILMSLGFLALSMAFGVPLMLGYWLLSGTDLTEAESFARSPHFIIVVNSLAAGGVLCWGYAVNRVPWHVLLPVNRVAVGGLGAVVVTSLGLSAVLSEIDNVFRMLVPMPDYYLQMFAELMDVTAHPWAVTIALVIVAPLTEETMFRGVILRGLLARHRLHVAVIVSSLLFGLIHLNPWQFVSATLLGLVYGWWSFRTRSLIPSLLGHAINNGIVVLLVCYRPDIPGYSATEFTSEIIHQPWWFTLAGVALTGLGVWWFAHSTRGGPPPEPVLEARPVHAGPPPLPVHALGYALAPVPVERIGDALAPPSLPVSDDAESTRP